MSSLLKLRRGSTVAHETFTGADGEVTFNTDTNALVTHDGATAGGFPHVKAADLAASSGASLVGFMPAGVGAVATTAQQKLRESVSVKDFGAVGDGVTDDTAAIQAAMDAVKLSRKSLFIPSGTYLISDTLTYTTPNEMLHNDPKNGVHIFGEQGTIIKAAAGWTTTKAMLNLDGNPTASEIVTAYVQQHNHIEKLEFDGSGVADRALRIRANWLPRYENLYCYDFKGAGLGVIDIVGVTTPTKDDADTTFGALFKSVRIRGSASGYGILGTNNRASSLTFIGCDIRDCYSDGIRLSVAGASFYGCIIAGCGNAGQNTTGGLSIVKPQTNARVRGIAIHGCEFENNYWHEINIDYCFGFTISGCFGSPYQHSGATTQSWIRMGGEAAQGGVLIGNSTMDYSDTYGYNINIYEFSAGASNISVVNPVIQRSTADDYIVHASTTNIKKDNVIISTDKKAAFSTYLTNGSADLAIATSTFTKIPFDTEEYDQGTGSFDAVTNRRFQPWRSGYYQINVGADFTPSAGASRCLLLLYKNGVAYKRLGDISAAGGQVTGGALVSLTGSDYVEAYIYITATTPKVAYGSTTTYMNGAFVADV